MNIQFQDNPFPPEFDTNQMVKSLSHSNSGVMVNQVFDSDGMLPSNNQINYLALQQQAQEQQHFRASHMKFGVSNSTNSTPTSFHQQQFQQLIDVSNQFPINQFQQGITMNNIQQGRYVRSQPNTPSLDSVQRFHQLQAQQSYIHSMNGTNLNSQLAQHQPSTAQHSMHRQQQQQQQQQQILLQQQQQLLQRQQSQMTMQLEMPLQRMSEHQSITSFDQMEGFNNNGSLNNSFTAHPQISDESLHGTSVNGLIVTPQLHDSSAQDMDITLDDLLQQDPFIDGHNEVNIESAADSSIMGIEQMQFKREEDLADDFLSEYIDIDDAPPTPKIEESPLEYSSEVDNDIHLDHARQSFLDSSDLAPTTPILPSSVSPFPITPRDSISSSQSTIQQLSHTLKPVVSKKKLNSPAKSATKGIRKVKSFANTKNLTHAFSTGELPPVPKKRLSFSECSSTLNFSNYMNVLSSNKSFSFVMEPKDKILSGVYNKNNKKKISMPKSPKKPSLKSSASEASLNSVPNFATFSKTRTERQKSVVDGSSFRSTLKPTAVTPAKPPSVLKDMKAGMGEFQLDINDKNRVV